jgi:hypothetical protein
MAKISARVGRTGRDMTVPLVLSMLVLLLGGCQPGRPWWVMRNAAGQDVLANFCLQGYTPAQCDAGVRVTVTKNPADDEFWQFEPRSSIKAWVAQGGVMEEHYLVIGSQAACEAARARVGFPTTSCHGPSYFRREAK